MTCFPSRMAANTHQITEMAAVLCNSSRNTMFMFSSNTCHKTCSTCLVLGASDSGSYLQDQEENKSIVSRPHYTSGHWGHELRATQHLIPGGHKLTATQHLITGSMNSQQCNIGIRESQQHNTWSLGSQTHSNITANHQGQELIGMQYPLTGATNSLHNISPKNSWKYSSQRPILLGPRTHGNTTLSLLGLGVQQVPEWKIGPCTPHTPFRSCVTVMTRQEEQHFIWGIYCYYLVVCTVP